LDARIFKRAEGIPRFEEVRVKACVTTKSSWMQGEELDLEICGTTEGDWMEVEVGV
jgi:hypothetical protein